jgi:hypothetical protein
MTLERVQDTLDCFKVNKQHVLPVTFQVLREASMMIIDFWDIAPCSLVKVHRRFKYGP